MTTTDAAVKERQILGAILLNNDLFPVVWLLFQPDAGGNWRRFTDERHDIILYRMWCVCNHNDEDGNPWPIDLVNLATEMYNNGDIDEDCSFEYLNSLIDGVPDLSTIPLLAESLTKTPVPEHIKEMRRLIDIRIGNSGEVRFFSRNGGSE